MTLTEILRSNEVSSETIIAIKDAMTEHKIFTTNEENIEERYNKLKGQKESLEAIVAERDAQLTELSAGAENIDELTAKIATLQEANESTKLELASKLKERDFNYALEVELMKSKAKNVKTVMPLLNKDSITLNEAGELVGLKEQVEELKKQEAYLFNEELPKGTGGAGNFGRSDGEIPEDKLTYSQMMEREARKIY